MESAPYRMSPPVDIEPPVVTAPPPPPIHTRERPPEFVEYAGFWLRVVANFIDSLLIVTVTLGPGIVIALLINTDSKSDLTTGETIAMLLGLLLMFIGPLFVGWLYEAYMLSSPRQATLGKQAVGIKVTDMDGNRISFAIATGRHFSKIISFFTLYVGFIMAAFTERKQALHDLIMKTLVVKGVR